ncbi:hypothetical protein [Nocardioides bigeumensis]|uniref:lipopolysaccharide biosynthesis protein n=1 Tax=Nocardioides bigeumensis TaxID=433657 RepID=UPI0031E36AB7
MGRASRPARRSGLVARLDLTADPQLSPVPNVVLSFTGVVAQGVVRLIYSLLIAANFGPAVLGDVNSLIALVMFAAMLWPTAVAIAASKYVALARGAGDDERVDAVATHLAWKIAITSAALAVATAIVAVLLLSASAVDTALSSLLVVTYSAYGYVRGVGYGAAQIARATVLDLVSSSIAILGLVAVLAAGYDALVLLPLAVGYGVYAACNWPRLGGAQLSEDVVREIRSFTAYGVLGVLAGTGLSQMAMLMARVALGASDAGQLAAALSLATPTAMLGSAIALVFSPALARLVGRGESATATHHTDLATRALNSVMVACFGVLILMSDELIVLLYPPGYEEAASLLPLLLAAGLLPSVATGVVAHLLVAHPGGQRIFAACNVAALVAAVTVSGCLLATLGGLWAVAIGYLVGGLLVGSLPLVIVWRREGFAWGEVIAKMAVGSALVSFGLCLERTTLTSTTEGLAVSAAFLALWLVACRRDLARAYPYLTRRGG